MHIWIKTKQWNKRPEGGWELGGGGERERDTAVRMTFWVMFLSFCLNVMCNLNNISVNTFGATQTPPYFQTPNNNIPEHEFGIIIYKSKNKQSGMKKNVIDKYRKSHGK